MYDGLCFFFFFQAEDGIRDHCVTGVQTCALPILHDRGQISRPAWRRECRGKRSEEHTSELQSHSDLVCRLLLEKKKKNDQVQTIQKKKKKNTQNIKKNKQY